MSFRTPEDRTSAADVEQRTGLLLALAGFLIWGLSPLFWKALAHVPATEQLGHRVVWCGLIMALLLGRRGIAGVRVAVRNRRTLAALVASTALIGFNWGLYIWSVATDHILHASLGYFINPLVNVLLGVIFLGERLGRAQRMAVAVAAIGVAILTWRLGELPWISLALAASFALYALVRKVVAATPEEGLAMEAWILTPAAVIFLLSVHWNDGGAFGAHGMGTNALLLFTGVITAVPLLLFTHGAKRLPLSTLGLLQYIAPTCQFLLAVLVYREPFDRIQLLAFAFIWAALAIFTVDLRRRSRVA